MKTAGPDNVVAFWLQLALVSLLVNIQGCIHVNTHTGTLVACVNTTSAEHRTLITIDCLPQNYIRVPMVEAGRTARKDPAFCESPSYDPDEHCIQRADPATEAYVRLCGAVSTCRLELTALELAAAVEAGCPGFQGDVYVSIIYLCFPRRTHHGIRRELFQIGEQPTGHYPPGTTVFLLSPGYGQLTPILESVCRVEFSPADTTPSAETRHHFVIEVYDFYASIDDTTPPFDSPCPYKLVLSSTVANSVQRRQLCPENNTRYVELGEFGSSRYGTAHVEFLRQHAKAEGRLWLKVEVRDSDDKLSKGGLHVSCTLKVDNSSNITSVLPPKLLRVEKTSTDNLTHVHGNENGNGNGKGPADSTTTDTGVRKDVGRGEDVGNVEMQWLFVGVGVGGSVMMLTILLLSTALCVKTAREQEFGSDSGDYYGSGQVDDPSDVTSSPAATSDWDTNSQISHTSKAGVSYASAADRDSDTHAPFKQYQCDASANHCNSLASTPSISQHSQLSDDDDDGNGPESRQNAPDHSNMSSDGRQGTSLDHTQTAAGGVNSQSALDNVDSALDHINSTSDSRYSTLDHKNSTLDHKNSTSEHRNSTLDHRNSTSDHKGTSSDYKQRSSHKNLGLDHSLDHTYNVLDHIRDKGSDFTLKQFSPSNNYYETETPGGSGGSLEADVIRLGLFYR